jgi:phosphate transport system permease protein
MPESILDPGRVLSVHVFDLAMNVAGGDANAYAASLVLVAILLLFGSVPVLLRGRDVASRVLV